MVGLLWIKQNTSYKHCNIIKNYYSVVVESDSYKYNKLDRETTPTKHISESYKGYNHNLQMIPLDWFLSYFRKRINQEYNTKKVELIKQLNRINEADVKFYNTCEKLLKFAQNAHNMFIHGTIEDKRFITQTVLSYTTYYDGKLDVELHPVFDTLFRLSKEQEFKKSAIEPSESADFTNKKHFLRSVLIMAGTTRPLFDFDNSKF